ncbi:MAG TPA: glycine/sarcosine/betaine reductase complex component C subunit beta [Candidatus Binataceae bacterium]|nr:glycine/sarcosine/betaine reductase complex component C subunit beta [Candidatus Binataceae bacterium]
MIRPALLGASTVLAHTPSLIALGSKPSREIARDGSLYSSLLDHVRDFPRVVGYAPNQAFIGAIHPREMGPRPYFDQLIQGASRYARDGEIMPEQEFFGLMALADRFQLVRLAPSLAISATAALRDHPLAATWELDRLALAAGNVEEALANGATPIYRAGSLAATISPGHPQDSNLNGAILAENLACKASGALALSHLLAHHDFAPASIDYVLGCAEEAVGDRYQRGGGNMGKAIAEMAGCVQASGADVKNFCAAPLPALVVAASLVAAGVFGHVAVVGGGSLAKLGMKFQGHLQHAMPVLEDTLGAVAVLIGPDDGRSPLLRLDCVGHHPVASGAATEAILDSLLVAPLSRLELRLTDIDQFVTELHNPEITEPQGSGNVPERNYRMIAALAIRRGLLARTALESFIATRGLPGFAPTQGHIASAFCYLGHARRALMASQGARRIMLMAKGSLFLGLMTEQSDGMSLLLERNPRLEEKG